LFGNVFIVYLFLLVLMEDFILQIEKLRKLEAAVIVEGKKDREALEKFKINNIFELSKRPLFAVIEDVSDKYDECIILTDLDRQGRELFGKLNSGLIKNGVKVNNTFRNYLFRTKLRQIEGLVGYIMHLQQF